MAEYRGKHVNKVVIIGSGGAGKSTFSRKLSEAIGVRVYHLDCLFWKPGWVSTPRDEWVELQREVIEQDSWIIDGNYGGTLDIRLQAADTIIFLDLPRWLCMYRIIKRYFQYRKGGRPDITEGCLENLNLEFVKWVWNFRRDKRDEILRKFKEIEQNKTVIILQTREEVEAYLERIKS